MSPRFPDQVVSYIKYTLLFAWSKSKSGSVWLVDEMLRHLRIKILELWEEMLDSVFWRDVGRLRSGGNVWAFWGDIETFKMLEHLRKIWNIWEVRTLSVNLRIWNFWDHFELFTEILDCTSRCLARLRGNFEILGHLRGCLDVGLLLFINERLRNCWTVQRNVWTFQAPWFRNKMFKGNHSMTLSSFSLKDWYGLHKVVLYQVWLTHCPVD